MTKTNFVAKMINRPTTKGGTRIILSGAVVELLLIISTQYFPEYFTPEIVASLSGVLLLFIAYGASKEEKPANNEDNTPQRGITENPPIKR